MVLPQAPCYLLNTLHNLFDETQPHIEWPHTFFLGGVHNPQLVRTTSMMKREDVVLFQDVLKTKPN